MSGSDEKKPSYPNASECDCKCICKSKKPKQDGLTEWLTKALSLIGLGAGFIFALGWSYGYAYFEAWNMPFANLGLTTEHLFEYGRLVVLDHIWLLSGLAVLIVVCYGFGQVFFPGSTKIVLWPGLLAILVGFYLSTHLLGRSTAQTNFYLLAENNFETLPVVEIVLASTWSGLNGKSPNGWRKALIKDKCFRLIFLSDSHAWLARTFSGDPDPMVVAIPNKQIEALALLETRGNCNFGGSP